MLDGLDAAYCDYLERIWRELDRRYGDALWWTSLARWPADVGRHRARESLSTPKGWTPTSARTFSTLLW